MENPQHEEKQMTALALQLAGASSSSSITWDSIDWKTAVQEVRRLQLRIAKAFRERKHGKVKSLIRANTGLQLNIFVAANYETGCFIPK